MLQQLIGLSEDQIDAKTQAWLKRHENDRDLFDVLAEGIDGLINIPIEALRDKELTECYEEDEWN